MRDGDRHLAGAALDFPLFDPRPEGEIARIAPVAIPEVMIVVRDELHGDSLLNGIGLV